MKKVVLAVLIVLLAAVPAMAKLNIDPTGMSQSDFKDFSTELGLALSYIPLAPAEPLGGGVLPHFDVGVEATSVNISNNAAFWTTAATGIPNALLFPKVHAQLGLPVVPIDIGFVYSKVPNSDIKLTGGEIKWAILKGGTLTPALAIRGAYTKLEGVDLLDLNTKSLDISISKGFVMLTPYAGVGLVRITSEPDPSTGVQKEEFNETKSFVGLKLSLLPVLNIVGEADFASVKMYSFRLNLHF